MYYLYVYLNIYIYKEPITSIKLPIIGTEERVCIVYGIRL